MGPRFVGGRDTPDFRHALSNYTYFRVSDHVAGYGLVPFSELRLEGDKERKKEERKKNLCMYVGRPK